MVAMREVFGTDATTFGQFAVVDVACASLWMAVLLFLANRATQIDTRNGADTRAIDEMKARISAYEAQNARIPTLTDLMLIVGVALGGVGLAHAIAAPLSAWFKANISWASQFSLDSAFVWVVLLSTLLGLGLSFTRARTLESAGASRLGTVFLYFLIAWFKANISWASQFSLDSAFVWVVLLSTLLGLGLSFTRARKLESAGASRLGTVFLYFLIACIGMQMNLLSLLDRPWLFLLGVIWMLTHILVLWIVAKLVRAPLFFFGIGSMGNIGAAASAPVVAAAFHPSLAPVGVLLGTVGYATGTGLAYVTGLILKWMAGG